MSADTLLIFCTCPDRPTAEGIAETLVDEKLAACISLTSPLTSIYLWEGKRERSEEILLLIKTAGHGYEALERRLVSLHPYELPEIIAVPVERGLPGYLNWVEQCTRKTP
jgi:periplasmic divalent cation tolerance protein